MSLSMFCITTFTIQKMTFKRIFSERLAFILEFINFVCCLTAPAVHIQKYKPNPFFSMFVLTNTVICSGKLLSYFHCMRNIRLFIRKLESQKNDIDHQKLFQQNEINEDNLGILKDLIKYKRDPQNFKDFVYFLFAPTLCFQLHYPKTKRIRKFWLFKRVCEFFTALIMIIYISLQYIAPILQNWDPNH